MSIDKNDLRPFAKALAKALAKRGLVTQLNDPSQQVDEGRLPNSSAPLPGGMPSFSRTLDVSSAGGTERPPLSGGAVGKRKWTESAVDIETRLRTPGARKKEDQ